MPLDARSTAIRGACPGVAAPMEAADGFLARLRLPGGAIEPSGARAVAEVAERLGNGAVELTSRANIQIRGLGPTGIGRAGERLAGVGGAGPDPAGDLHRDVVASPLTGHDPDELIDLSLRTRQAADLLGDATLSGLPPKFGVVLDSGGSAPVRHVPADICFGAVRTDGGPQGRGPVMMQIELGRALDGGDPAGACIAAGDMLPVLLAAARLCAEHGTRMADLVARFGRADLIAIVAEGMEVVWGNPENRPVRAVPPTPVAPLGVLAHRNAGRVNVGAAPLLGRPSPDMLRTVADLADATSALIRLTPWRGLVLLGVAEEWAGRARGELTGAGFSADPADPAHLVSACAGLPGCSSARADTLGAARALLHGPSPIVSRIHLSGCEKRCGANAGEVMVADDRGSFRSSP
ncbi:MAG: precorrin-3B synthase [Acidimicrobiales bacterium]